MDDQGFKKSVMCILILSISCLHLSIVSAFYQFSPVDNYLIHCGSDADSTIDADNRLFTGDSSRSSSFHLSAARSISLRDENPPVGSSPVYHNARVFKRPSYYKFEIRDKGTHMVRLHFYLSNSSNLDPADVRFHVTVNEYLVLSNFTAQNMKSPKVLEYMIWVDTEKLVISFLPLEKTNVAVVSAIEVISAPKDLIEDKAFINYDKGELFSGLTKYALETVYRVNIGGPKVTPFNDSLWRTWIPDNTFIRSIDGSERVYFSGRIKYQKGGASREVAPDNVYNSARLIRSSNSTVPNHNITWVFPVVPGFKYLLRTHFCDIASISLGLLYFNLYINGSLVYNNLDLTTITNGVLASPFYADFVIVADNSEVLTVSVGPSNMSFPYSVDAILNGIEILKINNSMGSLDGELSVDSVLRSWPRRNMGCIVPFFGVACFLLIASVVMGRRKGVKDSVAWSPLPVSDASLKFEKQLSTSKLGNI